MHWRWFLPFPLAAFLCGEAVQAPRLRPALPAHADCYGYEAARERYLLAYGYQREKPLLSKRLQNESVSLLKDCAGPEADLLRARAASLGESP